MKAPMRHWSARLSLLGRFGLMSLVVLVALGLAIGLTLKRQIEARALARATQLAQVIAEIGVQSRVQAGDLARPLGRARMDELDDVMNSPLSRENQLLRVKMFDRAGHIAYSDDRALIGESEATDSGVVRALHGLASADLEHGTEDSGRGGRTLEVYVPLHVRETARPAGALEIYLAYDPVAAEIRTDVLTLYILLGGGLAVLFVTLFRIVAGASRRLRHQALHDGLTDLPNRTFLYRQIERAIAGVQRGDGMVALLLIDLDRFKEVNDTLGHDHGDELLVEVAARLRGALRRGDTLARLGGDEFAVLLCDLPNRSTVVELAGRLHDALRRPLALRGVAVELEASIGAALCPDHGSDVNTLVQRADVAMYEAKRSRASIVTYSPERDPYSADRLGLLAELRRALANEELLLHYQPKVAVDGGAVTGVEALVRWQHPERGLLGPAEFVPLAERTGTVSDLTRWVLHTALAQSRRWRDAGLDLPVAINLAAANIVDTTLPEAVAEALALHGVPGNRLECEISEDTVMADPLRAMDVLGRLRDLGLRLSLDDFGTGHSSLAYLKRLPLDEVKIDRSFVLGMTEDENDAVIVRSTIDLARNLGLDVVAEGVENEEILRGLGDLHCDVAQGFHVSRPLPPAELEAWLAARWAATPSA
jgi:diguanylate cyclase (GGDEF)-like protein